MRLPCPADWLSIGASSSIGKVSAMASLQIEPVSCLRDNYAWLAYDTSEGVCAVVDPSEAEPVSNALAARGLTLTHILNTHHHPDHVGGNLALKAKFGAKIVGPGKDEARIPDLNARMTEVRAIRASGQPTLPSTIGLEKKTNPFLRTRSAEIRRNLGLEAADDVEVFAETRRRKDKF